MAPPILTIGMPVYNEKKYIQETLEGILKQTFQNFQLLISDNGSTDGTSKICQEYASQNSQITYIRHEQNKGAFFNFQYPLKMTETPYFVWASGHDKWHPKFLEILLVILETNKKIILTYPKMQSISGDGNLGKIFKNNVTTTTLETPESRYLFYLQKNYCLLIYGIWKTEILKKLSFLPIYTPDTILLAEASLWGQFYEHADVLLYFREFRKKETFQKLVARTHFMVTNKKIPSTSSFFLYVCLAQVLIKMLQKKELPFSKLQRLKLSLLTFLILFGYSYVSGFILEKYLPKKIYHFIRNFWRKWKRDPLEQ